MGAKGQRLKTAHSPLLNAEVKNGGAIPRLPIYLHGIVLRFVNTGTLPSVHVIMSPFLFGNFSYTSAVLVGLTGAPHISNSAKSHGYRRLFIGD
jgi:hypothetical protein